MEKTIAILSGDGIGPEIMKEAIKVLQEIENSFGHKWTFKESPVGGAGWDAYGSHFPDETKAVCEEADAILFGSVGGHANERSNPKWKNCEKDSILSLRKLFGFTINLRPTKIWQPLKETCVLRADLIADGVDILCVRELSEGIYFGEHSTHGQNGNRIAKDVMTYDEKTIEKAAHAAFRSAEVRKKKVTSVDKANVLDCGKLWREVVSKVALEYPDCSLEHLFVDHCALELIQNPTSFDVLLAPNMFGDILSDEISIFAGSLGMLPSASLNDAGFGMYEPSGGSAPDIAGQGKANPIGQILSAAMMLKYSFDLHDEHDAIVRAVEKTLENGFRTSDIASSKSQEKVVSTFEMGDAIVQELRKK